MGQSMVTGSGEVIMPFIMKYSSSILLTDCNGLITGASVHDDHLIDDSLNAFKTACQASFLILDNHAEC
ncbi:hypothetical protein D3C85_1866530 [compost metagenome]